MRKIVLFAVLLLQSVLGIGTAGAQQSPWTVTLMAGDPQRCAAFAELMEHPVIGRYQYDWGITGRQDDSWDSHYRTVAALTVQSPTSDRAVRFEHYRLPGQYRYGQTLAFALLGRPWTPAQSASGPGAIVECGSTQTQPIEACVLDDNKVAANFGFPALDARKIETKHGIEWVYGNSYYFYHFKDRYWLLIAPFRPEQTVRPNKPKSLFFGFALHDPDAIVEGRVNSLFEYGCQLESVLR